MRHSREGCYFARPVSRADALPRSDGLPTAMSKEPTRLQRGKRFHRQVQEDWRATAEGEIHPERSIVKPSGRRGRVDILVDPDESMVAVVEIKASDWDRMAAANVRRNVRRQVRQIWSYIESQLEQGKDVCPGIIFPERPNDLERLELIESLFEEEGIPVVWQDETIEERRNRG